MTNVNDMDFEDFSRHLLATEPEMLKSWLSNGDVIRSGFAKLILGNVK